MKSACLLTVLLLGFYTSPIHAQAPSWEWAKSGVGNGNAYKVCTDPAGNIYIVGTFESPTITFGNITLTNFGSSFSKDIYIAKYDPTGNVIWAKSAGGQLDDIARAVCSDKQGNVYIAGSYSSHSITFGTDTLVSSGTATGDTSANIFLVKYDSSGNVIWSISQGGTGYDNATALCTDSSGDLLMLAEYSSDTVLLGNTMLIDTNYTYPYYQKPRNMFVAKYDRTGALLWAKGAALLYITSFSMIPTGIATDARGNIYALGYYVGEGAIFGTDTITTTGASMYLAKYDPAGNLVWLQSSPNANALGICIGIDEHIYITGTFYSNFIVFGNDTLNDITPTYNDIFIAKYDTSGNVLWAKRAGGLNSEDVAGISADKKGGLYIAGSFFDDMISFGTYTITSPGNSFTNLYVAKYDTLGDPIWAISTLGIDSNHAGNVNSLTGLATDRNGNVYVGGYLNTSTLTFGNTTIVNTYYNNIFLAKVDTATLSTGLTPVNPTSPITVYPNPSGGMFYFSGVASGSAIEIYDLLGQEITSPNPLQRRGLDSQYIVDLSGRQAGMYFYRVTDVNNTSHQGKIVVE